MAQKPQRLIARNQISTHTLIDLADQARRAYVETNTPGQFRPEAYQRDIAAAFLAGAGFGFKMSAQMDVPWMARNVADDAGERVCQTALLLLSTSRSDVA